MDELEKELAIEQAVEESDEEKEREAFMLQYGEDPEDVLGRNWLYQLHQLR